MEQGCCLEEAQALGHRDEVVGLDDGLLGVAAGSAVLARMGDDAPTDPARVGPRPDRAHGAGHAVARHVGGPEGKEVRGRAGADHGIEEEQVCRGHVDHRLSRTGDGVGDFQRDEYVGTAEPRHLDDLHLPSLVVSSSRYFLKFT